MLGYGELWGVVSCLFFALKKNAVPVALRARASASGSGSFGIHSGFSLS